MKGGKLISDHPHVNSNNNNRFFIAVPICGVSCSYTMAVSLLYKYIDILLFIDCRNILPGTRRAYCHIVARRSEVVFFKPFHCARRGWSADIAVPFLYLHLHVFPTFMSTKFLLAQNFLTSMHVYSYIRDVHLLRPITIYRDFSIPIILLVSSFRKVMWYSN